MVNRAEMAFITLSSLMQSHSHRGCPFYPATSSLGLIQNAAWRLLTFDRQSGRLPRHHEKKGMGKRVRVNSLDENLWMVMGHGWAHTLLAALGTRWKTREMCEKQLRFESYLHCFSQYLEGEFRNYISCNFAQLPTKCEHTKVEQVRVYCCFCFCFVFGVSL